MKVDRQFTIPKVSLRGEKLLPEKIFFDQFLDNSFLSIATVLQQLPILPAILSLVLRLCTLSQTVSFRENQNMKCRWGQYLLQYHT